jgi:twitching motility protein PilT
MILSELISMARANGASDLHLEPGLPAAIRVRGTLKASGSPIPGKMLLDAAREIIGTEGWDLFQQRRSFDVSRNLQGARCRINILHTARGVGFAIRLLAGFEASLDKLNLHPDLKKLVTHVNGLVIISGPTGCGKSTTMAAMIQEINLMETRHIVTIESPIEYQFKPHRAYIRQREVGRDTPSFEQALMDALREDPDVLMVGEMRDPETMRLTLNAAETGHLVLATAHSATATEALQRVVSAFPPEIQSGVCAQLADCLVAVVCQQLHYRSDLKIQVPECEILMPTHAVKNFVRRGEFFKVGQAMETGADQGMFTYTRYRSWLDAKKTWHFQDDRAEDDQTGEFQETEEMRMAIQTPAVSKPPLIVASPSERPAPSSTSSLKGDRLEIKPEEGGLDAIITKLKNQP